MSNEDKNILNDFLNKQQAVDDFEKEALEGFSQLSNQEITALKHKTDDKAEKLFDKKNKPAFYWIAAAVIIICMGLLIKLFIPSNEFINKNNVAINNNAEKEIEQPKDEFNSKVAELSSSTNENNLTQKEESSSKSNQVSRNNLTPEKSKSDNYQTATGALNEPVKSLSKNIDEQTNLSPTEKESKQPFADANDDMAKAETKSEMLSDGEKKESVKKKVSALDKNTPSAPAQAAMGDEVITVNNLYYEGGDKNLTSDLRDLLKTINLNTAFDVLISVNDELEVTTVEFIDERELSKDEKNLIKKEIKKLSKFKYKTQPTKNSKSQYKIIYRP
ncbi:MAG: hypothetical protein U0V03_02405 [Bacteroidia bacterium]